jgi:hypothetical protein
VSSAAKETTKSIPPSRRKTSRSSTDQTETSTQSTNGSPPNPFSESRNVAVGSNGGAATQAPETQIARAAQNGNGAIDVPTIQTSPASYAYLALAAETLEDIERVRIAAENRRRALTHPEQKINLPEDHPHVAEAEGIAEALRGIEKQAELQVKRMVRQTPLGAWVKNTIGIGEKQAGRLLGVIGDPLTRLDQDTGEVLPRTVGQLRSYCGYGDAERQRRRKGEQANWNAKARMRTYLIAESCMKSPTSPYRKVYEEGRVKYAEAKHQSPCAQCGQKGKPAPVDSDLRDGHKHARALRLVSKAVLKDLWIAAGQSDLEVQPPHAR